MITRLLLLVVLAVGFSQTARAGCWSWQKCDEYQTRFPIVLVHGVAGWDTLLGIDYFYGVRDTLEQRGATVYTPNVAAWHDAYTRGEQLINQLDDIRAISGQSKFNLVGHSLGGPTVRYVAGTRPDLVASVTTVNAVNFGSDFADAARGIVPVDSATEALIEAALNAMGKVTDILAGNSEYDQDALAAVDFMTSPGADKFNRLFPDGMPASRCGSGAEKVNGIYYYSWGGNDALTNIADPLDFFLGASGLLIEGEHDGLVERCDQHWGQVIRSDYAMNHADAINHLFGLHGLFNTDPLAVYEQHAARLKGLGL
ncbi:lipase family alpha/beta hydrolase [Endozoicomonadaceae bacterium StTr2]